MINIFFGIEVASDNDGDGFEALVFFEGSENIEAADFGEENVEKNDLGDAASLEIFECSSAIRGEFDYKAHGGEFTDHSLSE